jgi:hypothetical protein
MLVQSHSRSDSCGLRLSRSRRPYHPAGAVRAEAASPQQLGVHPSIQSGTGPPSLPPYVPRDVDEPLRIALNGVVPRGGMVLLIGASSVGKTRTLYEAVRTVLPQWWLLHREQDRGRGRELMVKHIDSISHGVPKPLTEVITLGRTLKKRAADVLAYFDRPGTSNGPTEAINGRLEHLRGSALGFRNLTNYIARSLLETGGFRPQLHPHL